MTMDESLARARMVEYRAAQDSAQFNDLVVWIATGITWGLSALLLGVALANPTRRVVTGMLSIVGILFVIFQWQVQGSLRSVKKQKYDRCKQIEAEFKMTNHSGVVYQHGSQTAVHRGIFSFMIAAWLSVLYAALAG
jgi:hypothetical protein